MKNKCGGGRKSFLIFLTSKSIIDVSTNLFQNAGKYCMNVTSISITASKLNIETSKLIIESIKSSIER
jgi:hypothetical protein